MELLFKKTDARAVEPRRAHDDDFGLDVYAIEVEEPNEKHPNTYKVRTGLAFEMKFNIIERLIIWLFNLVPVIKAYSRSSIHKQGLVLSNGTGLVDNGYRGEVTAEFYKFPFPKSECYKSGERCFQIAVEIGIKPRRISQSWRLSEGSRGANGYGSTGK